MPTINRITNPRKVVQDKINYFLDRLTHAATFAGWQWHLELDSPTALIENILFRLKEDSEYRLEYFDNYFDNSFFAKEQSWDEYKGYSAVKATIIKYNSIGKSGDRKQEKIKLIDSAVFQRNLLGLKTDLLHKMPKNLVDAIFSQSQCEHTLDEIIPGEKISHKDFFDDVSLKLVAEYTYRGYTKSEIKNIISRVFGKDVDDFPFPLNIKTKAQKRKHLSEHSLKNQLHGFTNIFNQQQSHGIVLLKVYGASFPNDFEFTYDEVKFYGKNHKFFTQLKKSIHSENYDDFFKGEDFIIAFTELNWHSEDSLLKEARLKIRNELAFISLVLNRDLSIDTTNNYIRLNTKKQFRGLAWSTKKFNHPISKTELDELRDNGFEALRGINSEASQWFLQCEGLFVTANKNRSISDYWMYLEALLSYNSTKKAVKEIVSSIILTNEKLIKDRRILTTVRDSFDPLTKGFSLLTLPFEKRKKMYSDLSKGKVPKEIREVQYPFIQVLLGEFDTPLIKDDYKKAKRYYYRLLTDAYEFRNLMVHQGLEKQASKEKLLTTLPNLIVRLRWAIFEELKMNDSKLPFDMLIENLKAKAELLLKN